MDWLANLSIGWVAAIAIGLAAVRIGIAKARSIPKDTATSIGELIEALLFALVLVFLVIRPFVVQAFYIPSASMRPTLWEGDRILVNRLVYRLHDPQRGDVIVFKAPKAASDDGQERDFIKRVIGLPGDTVEVRDDPGGFRVYVNQKPLKEHYVDDWYADDIAKPKPPPPGSVIMPNYTFPPYRVPAGCLFVMGDNRPNSRDSHYWYGLSRDRVIGKAMLIFWPPSRIGLVR